jgi:hypothetical protein
MAYIGNSPANIGNYQVVDDISSTFNGVLTSFALTASSLAINPAKSGQLLVSINGVLQEPDDTGTEGFKVSGSNIVFSSAPATGSTFWAVWQGQAVDIGTPSDNTVGNAQVADDALSGNKIDGGTISNFTSTGIDDNATSTQVTITDTNVAFGADTSCINMAVAEDIRHAGDGNTYLSFEADTLACYIGGTNTLQLTSGQMMSPTGITLGNGTTYAAANTLDDYETGTWSPQVFYQNSTDQANATNTTQTGVYTKIGRLVILEFRLIWTAGSAVNDNIGVKNLPFPGGTVDTYAAAGIARAINQNTIHDFQIHRPSSGSSTAIFDEIDDGDTDNLGNEWGTGSGKEVRASLTYYTDS